MIVELSEQLRAAVNATITETDLKRVEQTSDAFLSRIACRILLFPSGTSLQRNLRTAAGAMVYGKILYGGVARYRVIGSSGRSKRKAGERTAIASPGQPAEAWLQYGGPERNYDAVDMGPCALMEFTILPKGLTLPLLCKDDNNQEMSVLQVRCNPNLLLDFPTEEPTDVEERSVSGHELLHDDPLGASEMDYLEGLESTFTTVLGGLGNEIESIV
jgi:hypothetical protein